MEVQVHSVPELGEVVRAARRQSRVRLDDLATTAGVSKQFVSDVEYGKPTVQFGLVLKVLAELGVPLKLDIPKDAVAELIAMREKGGVLPPKLRAAATKTPRARRTEPEAPG